MLNMHSRGCTLMFTLYLYWSIYAAFESTRCFFNGNSEKKSLLFSYDRLTRSFLKALKGLSLSLATIGMDG
jgi:hypothetical protein